MADEYPEIAGLQAAVARRIYPRPASATSSPNLDRAVEALRKVYPADMAGVDIADMPWTNDYAGTNILGATDPQSVVRINPVLSIAFPQKAVEGTLAHELEHVRQNRLSDKPALDMLKGLSMGDANPREEEARAAKNKYVTEHGDPNEIWRTKYPISSRNFPKSPLVK